MGIYGLSPFISSFSSLHTRLHLSSSSKVKGRFFFDGNAYAHAHQEHWHYGGEYTNISQTVQNTIRQLESCGIEPVFVFDGALPADKCETRKKRYANYIKRCTTHQFLLPLWTLEVIQQTLRDLNVRVKVCAFEADGEIVRMAQEENGYVVSQDSDMYLYPLIGKGYIPLSTLSEKSALVFCPSRLAQLLKLDVNHLPLLGILMGNDYVSGDLWRQGIERWCSERGITRAQWPMTVAEFIEANAHGNVVQNVLTALDKQDLEGRVIDALEKYNLKPSETCEGISRLLIDVLKNQTFWTRIFLEDLEQESSWMISLELRKEIYENIREKGQLKEYKVTEYIRKRQHLESVHIVCNQNKGRKKGWEGFVEAHKSKTVCLKPFENSSGVCYLILCLRYMIDQCSAHNVCLEDHEVVAITISTLRSLSPYLSLGNVSSPDTTPALNRRSIHLSAQFQNVIYSSHLLSQILDIEIHAPFALLYSGLDFHLCLEKARNGASVSSLLCGTSPEFLSLFLHVHSLVTQDLENKIRHVFDYSNPHTKPKKIRTKKKESRIEKKTKRTIPANMFDLLDSA